MSEATQSLKDRKVLVTGATGFIGGRLAERLAKEAGAIVLGTGRNLEKATHVREAGVELRRVNLTDLDALRDAIAGQEVVFHLVSAMASDTHDPETSRRINVTATEDLVRSAAEAGVKRFVHVSSMAAYGAPDRAIMSEDHPLDTNQRAPYGRTKALGEIQARKTAADLGLELAVIRPGMVFGPRGRTWTMNLLRLVQRRVPVLLGGGKGHAQPVYVDNLVDGMMLAATQPQAAGEAFNFIDQPLPWRDFFGFYGQMCGRTPIGLPLWMARLALLGFKLVSRRSESIDHMLNIYTNQSVYPIVKAERLLGFRPHISIEEGMKRTEAWLREAGYLPAVKKQ